MSKGFKVSGTTRSEEKAQKLEALGIEVISPAAWLGLDFTRFTHILSSIPPQSGYQEPDPAMRRGWIAYLSTTGVYGDWQGEWVDETSELRPNNERLNRRVAAEKEWLARGGHVFRLAGIYGPGRSAIDDVRGGTARRIDKPGQVFSRIHVEDIAQVVVASMLAPNPGSVYNGCDDEPAPAHEVVAYACKLLDMEPPPMIPFEQAEMSPMGREFYAANRRVRNDKIKRELGMELCYPSYREGLAQCLQSNPSE
ncbi:MAG: SDR family oxidoreductase [Alphaproteobacteria bacterium]|nr:SDR family oxidoreductase [Alphaproteobacteria bacterium]